MKYYLAIFVFLLVALSCNAQPSSGAGPTNAGGGSSEFTDGGTLLLLNETTDDLAIGAAQINSAKFSVDGDSDKVQVAIQGHSTQTANLVEIEDSGGTVLWSVDPSGNQTMADLTVTGTSTLGSLEFEGATADAFETTLTVTDPTADRTVTLPDTTGTVALTSDLNKRIYINAGAFIPTTTAGSAAATVELATNDIMVDSLDFDASTDEFANAWFALPDTYTSGNVAITIHWTAASGSGDVYWATGIRAFPDSEAMDQAITLSTAAADTLLTANDVHLGPLFSSEAILGTGEGPGVLCAIKISRDADNASDTLAVDARFLGVTIEW